MGRVPAPESVLIVCSCFYSRDGWSWFGMAELRGLFRFSDIPGQQLLGQWLSGPGQPVFAQAPGVVRSRAVVGTLGLELYSALEEVLLQGEPAPSGLRVGWHHWLVGLGIWSEASGAEPVGRKFGALGAQVPADLTSFLPALECIFAF